MDLWLILNLLNIIVFISKVSCEMHLYTNSFAILHNKVQVNIAVVFHPSAGNSGCTVALFAHKETSEENFHPPCASPPLVELHASNQFRECILLLLLLL